MRGRTGQQARSQEYKKLLHGNLVSVREDYTCRELRSFAIG